MSRGRGIRTPINGFGDRHATIAPSPYTSGVNGEVRTLDRKSHNLVLYQLSYVHHIFNYNSGAFPVPTIIFLSIIIWCSRAELNHRHPDFQSSALPTELQEHINRQLVCCIACITLILLLADLQLILSGNQNRCLVPRTGLEPVTYCLEGSCCCPSELSGHIKNLKADAYVTHLTIPQLSHSEWHL